MINRTLLDRQSLLKGLLVRAPPEGFPISSAMTGRMVALLPGQQRLPSADARAFACKPCLTDPLHRTGECS